MGDKGKSVRRSANPTPRLPRVAIPQTPQEKLIPGNRRVTALSGKTTWLLKPGDIEFLDGLRKDINEKVSGA